MRSTALSTWPDDVLQAVAGFRQGHLIEDPPPFSYYGDIAMPLGAAPDASASAEDPPERELGFLELEFEYGIITSQTCDIAEEGQPEQPFVQASPVFKYDDAPSDLPHYLAPLDPPDLPEGSWVADLRLEVPIEKTVLVGRKPIEGFPDESGYLDFARRLGRRKERPAVASELVDAVAKTLKRRKANSNGFKRFMRDEVRGVRLAIDEGTRLNPTIARVHFVGHRALSDEAQDKLATWWQAASKETEAAGIKLLPNAYHDGTAMDITVYERTIPLKV